MAKSRFLVVGVLVLVVGAVVLADRRTQLPNARDDAMNMIKADDQAQRSDFVLEVIGLGVTVEKFRQGALWAALQSGNPYSTLRETDPKRYPWSTFDKDGVSGGRALDALENGVKETPMHWGVPSFYAGPPIAESVYVPSAIDPMPGLAGSALTTDMTFHLFVTGPWRIAEHPDTLFNEVFDFFDRHPDVPYVVVTSEDSSPTRNIWLPRSEQKHESGYFIPAMPDASAVLVLARRERVEPLRRFVWDDPESEYLQTHLRQMYFELVRTVPNPVSIDFPDGNVGRQPTINEWLSASARFAKDPRFAGDERKPFWAGLKYENRWSSDWRPTPWFPLPWNREQMEDFDRLPSFGFIHRPVFVKYVDIEGRPIKRLEDRKKLLAAAWQRALQTLPEAERTRGPARVVGAFGENVDQRVALESVLSSHAVSNAAKIDTNNIAQFTNLDKRFGNTGAATFFVEMAIGVMGSYLQGGTSAAVNLRDPDGASIVFVSPPARQDVPKANRWAVLKHSVGPAIDPANYSEAY